MAEKPWQMARAMDYVKHSYCLDIELIKQEIVCEADYWQHPHIGQVSISRSIRDPAFGLLPQLLEC